MRWPKTLRVRFALWVAGLLIVAFSLFGTIVYASLAQGLTAAVDNGLYANASRIILNAREDDENEKLLPGLEKYSNELDDVDLNVSQYTFHILDLNGEPVGRVGPPRDLSAPDDPVTTARQGQETFITLSGSDNPDQLRIYTAPVIEDNQVIGFIQIAYSLADVQNTLNRLLVTLLVSAPLVATVAGLGGYFLAVRALAPIDQITHTARRISLEDLSARLNLPRIDDEVGRLAATFDSMLMRLDEAFQREQQFVANASHELRTPLTAMQTIISSTLARPRPPKEYEQALSDLDEEADRMRTMTEGLLLLARNDVPRPEMFETLDLSLLLEDVVESLRPLAEDKGLELICDVPKELILTGDNDGLIRLFVNLLGNAIKYTEQGRVTVSAGQDRNGTVSITVVDTGDGIAPEQLPYIFDRFYRADKSRSTAGVGLGLAIAAEVAHAHSGTIKVDSEIGAGSTFTVQLAQIS